MTERDEESGSGGLGAVPPQTWEEKQGAAPQIEEDTGAEDAAEAAREEAYHYEPSWGGKRLCWSVSREAAWLELRCAMGAPPLYATLTDGAFVPAGEEELTPGKGAWVADAARIVFLCLLSPEEITRLRRDPEVLQGAVDRWMEEAVKPTDLADLEEVGMTLYNTGRRNRVEPVPDDGTRPQSVGNWQSPSGKQSSC